MIPVRPTSSLLLLPGLMCDAAFWQPLADARPCQVVDYGDADSITSMAEAVLAAAPPAGGHSEGFVLAGHSMGGRVALEVARIAPHRIQKIILMDTGYLPKAVGAPGDAEATGRQALIEASRQRGVGAMCKEWVKGMVHPQRLDDSRLIDSIVAMFERKTAGRFARQQQALLNRPDASPVLSALRVPILLLCGRQDSWSSVGQHEAMQLLAPHAQLSIIEEAGHMVMMEQPDATLRAIHEFLDDRSDFVC